MSKLYVSIPKGRAMALHLTEEYQEGIRAAQNGVDKNPYKFFDEYEKHYAWDIGWQKGRDES